MWPTYFIPGFPRGISYRYTVLTTPMYPVETIDALTVGNPDHRSAMLGLANIENIQLLPEYQSAILRTLLLSYGMQPEHIQLLPEYQSAILRTLLLTYTMQPEHIQLLPEYQSGIVKNVLLTYSNYPPENIQLLPTYLSGVLT